MKTSISNIHQVKELKMKHLVKTTTYFFDAHGCAEEGSTELTISDDECYQGLDRSNEITTNYKLSKWYSGCLFANICLNSAP